MPTETVQPIQIDTVSHTLQNQPTEPETPVTSDLPPAPVQDVPLKEPVATPQASPERRVPQIEEPQAEESEEVQTDPTTMPLPVAIAPENPIILSGIAQQTAQLLVKADGRTLFNGTLQAGSRPRWAARDSLELTLTNRNTITLLLQNQPLQFDATTQQAIRLNITRTQIRITPTQP